MAQRRPEGWGTGQGVPALGFGITCLDLAKAEYAANPGPLSAVHLARTLAHGEAPPAPDRGVDVDETRALVNEALELLNPRYAQALRLRMIEDRDREECARIMDVTVGNFDVILHRAAKAFRKKYPPR